MSQFRRVRRASIRGLGLKGASVLAIIATLTTQAATAGDIEGVVRDANVKRGLQGASIRLSDGRRQTLSETGGAFTLRDLAPGAYDLIVSYVGYADVTLRVVVPAKGDARADVEIGALANQAEEVLVTGTRRAEQNALQNKRAASNQKDVATADDAGKLPDRNAADAVQRLPGVSLVTDQGDGRYVTIRGAAPKLNNITVDGQSIGSPEAKLRQVALDAVPAGALARIEVVKSVTPDMDAQSVGGTVNLLTPSAFDQPGDTIRGSAILGYAAQRGQANGEVSGAYGTRLDPDGRLGLFLSANFSSKPYSSENQQIGNPWAFNNGVALPVALELRRYDLTRQLWGGVSNLDFRLDDDTKLFIHGLYNEFSDTERRLAVVYDPGTTFKNITPSGADFTKGAASRNSRERVAIQRLGNLTIGGERHFDRLTADLSANYNYAEEDRPRNDQWSFSAAGPYTGRLDLSDFFFRVNTDAAAQVPANFKFKSLKRTLEDARQTTYTLNGNLRWDVDLGGADGFLKTGVKYVDRDKIHTLAVQNYAPASGGFTLAAASASGPSSYYKGYLFGPVVDTQGIEGFFTANPQFFAYNATTSASQSASGAYDVSEKVTAGYGMASIDIGRVNVTGGLRVEQTDGTYGSFVLSAANYPEIFRKNAYTNVLPGLQARYELREDLVLRAAWTNTLGRPDYQDLAGSVTITPGTPTLITDGNPALKPFTATNFDFAAEYYLVPTGVLSIGPFYKDIKNPIYSQATAVTNVVIAGTAIASGVVTKPLNATKGHVMGLEVNYQQQLTFLPQPFDGLGLQANFTYTQSSVSVPGREKLPFFNQSRQVGNLAVYYEKDGLEARAALAFRGRYLDVLYGPGQDRYADGRRQVDVRLAYQITEALKIAFEGQNLTDAPSRFFAGARSQLFENEVYGSTYRLGLTFKL